MKPEYIIEGNTIVEKRRALLEIIKIHIEKLNSNDLKLDGLYNLEHFSLEFMSNDKTYHDPDNYECRLEPDPSDPEKVEHYCRILLILMNCKKDYDFKLPCRVCIETIAHYLGVLILQYQKPIEQKPRL